MKIHAGLATRSAFGFMFDVSPTNDLTRSSLDRLESELLQKVVILLREINITLGELGEIECVIIDSKSIAFRWPDFEEYPNKTYALAITEQSLALPPKFSALDLENSIRHLISDSLLDVVSRLEIKAEKLEKIAAEL